MILSITSIGLSLGSDRSLANENAEPADQWLGQVENRDLSKNPRWIGLLHYDKRKWRSDIISDEFFLAKDGSTSSGNELEATVKAYFEPISGATNEHPRCRFPGRYYWLNQQHPLPGYEPIPEFCARLRNWARLDHIDSVSVLLVSGYLGNPASAFGHSLLRFNSSENETSGTLLDLTFNFGALVPEDENTIVYIMRGLFGGYRAGFSDSYYYSHDLTYTRSELRDIWNYQLNLTRDEITQLVLHLWEVVGKKFEYYFTTDNCSSRMAAVIGVAIDPSIIPSRRISYIPVELFHELHDLDGKRNGKLIESIDYIPSKVRVVEKQFDDLSKDGKNIIIQIINDQSIRVEEVADLLEDRRDSVEILNTLLAYYEYRIEQQKPDVDPELKTARLNIIKARLHLPPSHPKHSQMEDIPSPAEGHPPMKIGVGMVAHEREDNYARLEWSPFHYDMTGFNGLENGEFVVMDTVIGVESDGDAFLDSVDFLSIRNFSPRSTSEIDGMKPSWHLRLGVEREEAARLHAVRGVASGGIGVADALNGSVTGYISMDGWAYFDPDTLAAGPSMGILGHFSQWKWWLQGGTRKTDDTGDFREHALIDFTYRLNQHAAIHFEARYDQLLDSGRKRASISLRYFY